MLPGGTAASSARAERVPRASWLERAVLRAREDPFRLGVGVISAALATFLLVQMTVWPPHEDETLVFFVTQQPIGEVFSTVFGERGGAPLHWLLAWLAGHPGQPFYAFLLLLLKPLHTLLHPAPAEA